MTTPSTDAPPQKKESFFEATAKAFAGAVAADAKKAQGAPPEPTPVATPKPSEPSVPPLKQPEPATGIPQFSSATTAPQNPVDPIDDVDFEKKKFPKSEQWNMLRQQRDALKKEVEEIKSKLSQAPQPSAVDIKEYEKIKAEHAEYSKKLQEFAVQHDPRFEQYFSNKINQALSVAVNTVGGEEGKRVAQLIAMPDSEWRNRELENVMGSMNPIQQAKIGSVLVNVEQINAERNAEIQRASDNFRKMQELDSQKAAQAKQQFSTVLDAQLNEAKKHLPWLQAKEGDDNWNSRIRNVENTAKTIFSDASTPEDLSRAAVWAAAAPVMAQELHAANAEIAKLRQQLAQVESASPSLSSGQTNANNGEDERKGESFGARIARLATRR